MAALLGVSASFSVVEHKGKLAACIDNRDMTGLGDRQEYLEDLLSWSASESE